MADTKFRVRQIGTDSSPSGQVPTSNGSGLTEWKDGPLSLGAITHEPTGFPNRTDSTISFDDLNLRFTIAPAVTSFDVYLSGVKRTKSVSATVDITDTEGVWYIYYNSSVVLVASQMSWVLSSLQIPIAIVYWDATNNKGIILGDERHGLTMDWATHQWAHVTIGTRYASGLAAGDYTVAGNGSLDAHAQLSITDGYIYDEDIAIDPHDGAGSGEFEQELAPIAYIPVYYRNGVAGDWRKVTAAAWPVKPGTNRIQYNLLTGGAWTNPDVTANGSHMAMWIFATDNYDEPIIAIMGQREDATLGNSQTNNTYAALALGTFPVQEAKVIYRLIYQTSTTYANTPHARLRDVLDLRLQTQGPTSTNVVAQSHASLGDRGIPNQHPASAIAPDTLNFSGNLSAADDDVQKALETLDKTPSIIKYVTGIDLTAVAQTTIFTVPTGKRFVATKCVVLVDSITGASTMPTVRFGTSGTADLFVAAELLDSSMNAAGVTQGWNLLSNAVAAAGVIQFGVTVGAASTTHVGTAIVEGILVNV